MLGWGRCTRILRIKERPCLQETSGEASRVLSRGEPQLGRSPGSAHSTMASHGLPALGRARTRPSMPGNGERALVGEESEQQRCLSVIPANKILFHYPRYNWFTAFFVYLSIRAAVKWLGKAIA